MKLKKPVGMHSFDPNTTVDDLMENMANSLNPFLAARYGSTEKVTKEDLKDIIKPPLAKTKYVKKKDKPKDKSEGDDLGLNDMSKNQFMHFASMAFNTVFAHYAAKGADPAIQKDTAAMEAASKAWDSAKIGGVDTGPNFSELNLSEYTSVEENKDAYSEMMKENEANALKSLETPDVSSELKGDMEPEAFLRSVADKLLENSKNSEVGTNKEGSKKPFSEVKMESGTVRLEMNKKGAFKISGDSPEAVAEAADTAGLKSVEVNGGSRQQKVDLMVELDKKDVIVDMKEGKLEKLGKKFETPEAFEDFKKHQEHLKANLEKELGEDLGAKPESAEDLAATVEEQKKQDVEEGLDVEAGSEDEIKPTPGLSSDTDEKIAGDEDKLKSTHDDVTSKLNNGHDNWDFKEDENHPNTSNVTMKDGDKESHMNFRTNDDGGFTASGDDPNMIASAMKDAGCKQVSMHDEGTKDEKFGLLKAATGQGLEVTNVKWDDYKGMEGADKLKEEYEEKFGQDKAEEKAPAAPK